jgi:hypothetical protein
MINDEWCNVTWHQNLKKAKRTRFGALKLVMYESIQMFDSFLIPIPTLVMIPDRFKADNIADAAIKISQ